MFKLTDFYSILNSLGGVVQPTLHENIRVLSESEKNKTQTYFENVVDQICFGSDDYKRLKKFFVDWYASFRTIITTSKNSSDIFFLPDKYLIELFKSFGFTININLLSAGTKSNLFLDLVNMYKIKGTPQSIITVLGYFGLSDCDIAEYWLQQNSSGNLIFRSESVLSQDILEFLIPWSDISFQDMTEHDPHWLQTESQILSLIPQNKINLPSKSPYFAVRPQYNLTKLKLILAMVSRRVHDQYDQYVSTSIIPDQSIKLTNLNYTVSILELFVAASYVLNSHLNRSSGSSDSDFICYDGTSTLSFTQIHDDYFNLIKYPVSRSQRQDLIDQFNNLFTRSVSSSFLQTSSDTSTILSVLNSSLKSMLDSLIDAGSGVDVLSFLLMDLADWIAEHSTIGYPDLAGFVLSLRSFQVIKDIINAFKPYHARLSLLEYAYVVQDPLHDSVKVEDEVIRRAQENIVDFDTANSLPCCDSTSCSYYSRDTYDCGSYFDIGAAWDSNNVDMVVERSIHDTLNCHSSDSTTYVHLEYTTDSTTGDIDFITVSGGFFDFDKDGTFDCTHGSDVCQINIDNI